MSSTYTTLNDKRGSPHTTTLGSRESLILELGSTPSSIPISTISNSLVIISNCQLAQASIARIHGLDDSVELEMSTLASSTLPQNLSSSFVTKYTHTHTPKILLFSKIISTTTTTTTGLNIACLRPILFLRSGSSPQSPSWTTSFVLPLCQLLQQAPSSIHCQVSPAHLPRLEFFGDYTAWKIASYAHMYVFTN